MKDTRFLYLNDTWALATDGLQWILQRKQGSKWRGVSFIASSKAVLRRVLREKGVTPTQEANRAVDALLESYSAWWAAEGHKIKDHAPELTANDGSHSKQAAE